MIAIESWLKSFGFVSNPFETTEAGSEANYATDFLHATFVKPVGFEEILGHPNHPKSNLIFATRGQGKSSARIMTAHFCRNGLFPNEEYGNFGRILPVYHMRFERLLETVGNSTELVNAHVVEILRRAVPAFVKMLIAYPSITTRINSMDVYRRLELQLFLVVYQTYVSTDEFKNARDVLGNEITHYDEARTSMGFALSNSNRHQMDLTRQEIELRLQARVQSSPIDQIGLFASLLSEVGIDAVYVLVDGIDEISATADNFRVAANLLLPLLANLNLMNNTPHLAFKVFVPAEMKPMLLEGNALIRRDRIVVQNIELSEDNLVEILNRRLAYCSNDVVMSMDAVSAPEFRGVLGRKIVVKAHGNPRRLAFLGHYMIVQRCNLLTSASGQDSYLLTENDLENAMNYLPEELRQAKKNSDYMESEVNSRISASASEVTSRADDWFRHEFPAPIALSYLVYQRESNPNQRLWKLYELVEASLAYLSLVLLAMLKRNFGDETSNRIKRSGLRLERTSLGIWRVASRKLPGMLSGIGSKIYFARACQRLVNSHKAFLQTINDERNRSAHGGPQPDQACTEMLEQYEEPLHDYLKDMQFLRNSHLIRIESVKKNGEIYRHRCTHYVGDAAVYPTIEVTLPKPLESDRLWLIGDDDPVNLHPLIVVAADEKFGENIWLYQGKEDDSVLYKAYGMGRIAQSSTLFRENPRISL